MTLEQPVESGQLIINLRAEVAPDVLADAIRAAVAELPNGIAGLTAKLEHIESFRPGKPTPTHRIADASFSGR